MPRYYVFICEAYYPSGGMGDMVAVYDTLEEALEHPHWDQIIEGQIDRFVYRWQINPGTLDEAWREDIPPREFFDE
jgi:hypothetical protein